MLSGSSKCNQLLIVPTTVLGIERLPEMVLGSSSSKQLLCGSRCLSSSDKSLSKVKVKLRASPSNLCVQNRTLIYSRIVNPAIAFAIRADHIIRLRGRSSTSDHLILLPATGWSLNFTHISLHSDM